MEQLSQPRAKGTVQRIDGLDSNNLEVYRDIFASEYVNDVIYNRPKRIQKIQPILEQLGFIKNTHFIYTIIFDDFWAICANRSNAQRYQMKRDLLNQTRNVLAKIHPASVAATLIGTDKVVVLLECSDMSEEEAVAYSYTCAEKLRDGIMRRTTFSVSIGVSNYCHSLFSAYRAYEQSFQALSSSFALGYASVLKYEAKQSEKSRFRRSEISDVTKQFNRTITLQDEEQCKDQVRSFFRKLSLNASDENFVKSYIVLVLSEIAQYSELLGTDSNKLSRRLIVIIRDIFQSGTIYQLQEKMINFLLEIMGAEDFSVETASDRMKIVHAYIDHFFAEDISLRDLAKLSGYSEGYFCRLFKQTFGKTYSSFLIECRMNHAKKLLTETRSKISEISEMVGFHNFDYFCVCFRKYNGCTANEYRNKQNCRIN